MKKTILFILILILLASQAWAGFGGYIKADTQTNVTIGPVVSVSDGYTPVTTLSLSTADEAEIIKHAGTTVTDISGNTMAAITNADGYYYLTITSGQLDTEGRITVLINDDSLCLPVRADFEVVNANVYDSMYAAAATDYLQVDMIQVEGGDATDAINTEADNAIVTYKLDHLVYAAVESDDPVDNSIIAKLAASDGDWSGFDNSTDSLEALRDNQAAAADAVLLQNTTITVTDQTHFTLAAGSADDDAYNNMIIVFTDQTTAEQKSVRTVTDYTGASKTVTIDSAPDFTIATGDTVDILAVAPGSTPPTASQIADAVWDEASTGHTDAGKAGEQLWTDIDATLADTNELQTNQNWDVWDDGTRSLTELDEDNTTIDLDGSTVGTVTTLTGHTPQTGDSYARIGANGASLSAIPWNSAWDAEVESEVDDSLGGGTGTALTAIPWNASWDAEVQSECTDALNAYDPPTKAELDSGLAGLNDVSAAEVNAEVADVIKTDTISEMSQGAPPGSPTLQQAVNYLYKAWRNKNMTDSSTIEIYDDAGSTVLFKSPISDDGTDFTKGEYVTGP